MLESAAIVFNPASGAGDPDADLTLIREIFAGEGVDLTVYPPQEARQAVDSGSRLVLAAGGDGTVSAVADLLIGSGQALGVVPRGTANAFALGLGIPLGLEAACTTALRGAERVIDAARCNGRPMTLLAGIGFEAETVEKTDREAKESWGPLAYFLAGARQLGEQELFEVTLDMESYSHTLPASAVTVANVAPATSFLAQGCGEVVPDDGLLDVTVGIADTRIEAVLTFLDLMWSALQKKAVERENVIHFRTNRVRISATPPQKLVIDGELSGLTPVEVEVVPGGLLVMVPRA
ncbi:MAG: diacylglycerol kinase family protein [Bryobacteraceae bacterium]|nr:diacylglycerol kinase family protein [Bryobacteraceae bacterium]